MPRVTVRTTRNGPDEAKPDLLNIVKKAMEGLGESDARIKVFQYESYPTKPQYVEDVDVEVITTGSLEQWLKQNYGPGSYQVRAMVQGQWLKDGSRVIHIAGKPKDTDAPAQRKNGDGGDNDMWKFMMTMQQQASDRQMNMVAQMNTSMMTAISAIVSGSRPPDLAGMASLMQTFQPKNDLNSTLDTVVKIIDITGGGGGKGGEAAPDPMMMMLGAGLDLIKSRAVPAAVPATPQTPGAPAAPATAAPAPQATPQQQQVWSEKRVLEQRLEFLTMLKRKAQLGKPPEEWADYIEDNQDDAVCVWLLQMVRQHPWEVIAGALKQTDPELATEPCYGWFSQLYLVLTGEQPGNPDAEPKTSD